MQRKVIQLAGKTLVVSLPSKWAKKNSISKGDDIEIEEKEKSLIIRTDKEKKTDKKTINTKETGYFDPLYIAYLYQAGVDEIRINYDDTKTYNQIQEKIKDLMGYEIINQGENYVEIKNVSTALEEEFETILKRTYYLLEEMGRASLEAIEQKDYRRLKEIIQMENSVDKFTDFCKRVLNKKGYREQEKTQFYYVIIRDMEKIGDHYEKISKHAIETKKVPEKETLILYREANEFLKLFREIFYKPEKEKINKFQKKRKELKEKAEQVIHKGEKEELLTIYNLTSLIKLTGNLYGPYFSTTI